jgi:hypothetical protein
VIAGFDPKMLLEQGDDDYIINIALVRKTIDIASEQKIEEMKLLSQLIGLEVGKFIAKIF